MSDKKNQIKIEILDEGDNVIAFSDNRLVVKKNTGEVEIYTILIEDKGLPRIAEKSVLITYGSSRKISLKTEDGLEVGTF